MENRPQKKPEMTVVSLPRMRLQYCISEISRKTMAHLTRLIEKLQIYAPQADIINRN